MFVSLTRVYFRVNYATRRVLFVIYKYLQFGIHRAGVERVNLPNYIILYTSAIRRQIVVVDTFFVRIERCTFLGRYIYIYIVF